MVWASGAALLVPVVGAMAFWHAIIGVGEGLVTAGLVAYVLAVRPDLMKASAEVLRPRTLALSLGVLALVAAGVSVFASSSPDGLQHVASTLGFATATVPAAADPLHGYLVPGMTNETLAGVLAGLAGVLVTGALAYAGIRSLAGRRRSLQ
jgi:cobalt/nickel transport system permease protein